MIDDSAHPLQGSAYACLDGSPNRPPELLDQKTLISWIELVIRAHLPFEA